MKSTNLRPWCVRVAPSFLLAVSLVCATATAAEDVSKIFDGKRVTLAVPFGEGGGFDRLGRAFIRHFERHTGATAVVINETGAGGLLSANNGYVTDPKEFRIQMVNTVGAVAATLGKAPGVRFDLNKFEWIGSLSTEPDAILVNPNGRFKNIQSMLDHADKQNPVTFAASGPGDNLFINPLVVGAVFDFPYKIISGYKGGRQAWLGVLRGEADAVMWAFSAGLPAVTAGDAKVLALVGDRPVPYHADRSLPKAFQAVPLTDVPTIEEIATKRGIDDERMAVLKAHLAAREGGRALAIAPNSSPERVAAYRKMFVDVLNDKQFLSDLERQGLFLNPMLGEELKAQVAKNLASPDSYRKLILKSYKNQ